MNHQYQVATFRAAQQQALRNVRIHSPTLLQITAGSKRLFWRDSALELACSQILLCPAGASLSFENMPYRGQFRSRMFSFHCTPEPAMLDLSITRAIGQFPTGVHCDPNLRDTLDALYRFDRAALSPATQQFWILGLFQQLAEQGVLHQLFPAGGDTLARRLSDYLALSPANDHRLEQVAEHFAMSRATFIRKLKQEGTQYRDVLADVRLNHALRLMQDGEQRMTLLAPACGYQSPGRFSQRFRDKFGLTPNEYVKTLEHL